MMEKKRKEGIKTKKYIRNDGNGGIQTKKLHKE